MKKINLKGLSRILSEQELKNVTGGSSGNACSLDSLGLCGGNCMRPGGSADKCRQNSNRKCTCGGVA
jgi:bacteriocin-like protein